jgi:site-specific DNA recombinase
MRIVGYARVSTGEQADTGCSLDAQQHKLKLYAELHGHELVEVIVDAGVSASTLNRPGVQRALAMLTDGTCDGLLVYKIDRLTRSVRDLGKLIDEYFSESSPGELLSVRDSIDTSTATGRLMLNLLGSVAQWEREVIAERTREVLQHKRAKGERVGSVPYGYDLAADGINLRSTEHEQAAIRIAVGRRANGESLRKVGTALTRLGYSPRNGGKWHPETVRGLVGERKGQRRRR